jgi:hypothetical protein
MSATGSRSEALSESTDSAICVNLAIWYTCFPIARRNVRSPDLLAASSRYPVIAHIRWR